MTAPAVRTAIRDAGVYPSREHRRDALLELAVAVAGERGRVCQPITQVLPLIVPSLAAAACTSVLVCFDRLVEAVCERSRFDGNPSGWLDEHDLSQRQFDVADERTASDIDFALDELMGKSS